MEIKLFEGVEALIDMPKSGVKKGMVGAVLEIFTKPNLTYEVEFCDKFGRTVAMGTFLPDQIKPSTLSREEYQKHIADRVYDDKVF